MPSPAFTYTPSHIGLCVSDLERSLRFWVDGLGFEIFERFEIQRPVAEVDDPVDLTSLFVQRGGLRVERMGRGFAWLDTGTPESLMEAGEFVRTLETRQGFKIACPEEIAYRAGFIDAARLERLAEAMRRGRYGEYLYNILKEQDI